MLLGCYLQGNNGGNAVIKYTFQIFLRGKSMGSTLLTTRKWQPCFSRKLIFQEIGHHVHKFKRHGVRKKKGRFLSPNIQLLVYYRYLSSRKDQNLAEYKRAHRIFMRWTKKVEIALLNLEMRSLLGWKSTEREWSSLDEFEDITSRSTRRAEKSGFY